MGGWTPDFSVYRGSRGGAALFGAHYFGAPYGHVGPSFTAELEDPGSVRLLARRFEELWVNGHDVLPAIRHTVERAHALALDAAGQGRRAHGAGRPG